MVEKRKDLDKDNATVPKLNFNLNGISFTCDIADTSIIIGPAITSEGDTKKLMLQIEDGVKTYDRMCYTTDVDAASLIFSNMTIRSSSLSSANLNDRKEKERVGVSQFANGRFITCFSHIGHESVPFWSCYGGDNKTKKVLFKFKNFTKNFMNV